MNVHLSGHHVEVTPTLRDYLSEKLVRVKRHFPQAIDIHATFSVEKGQHKAALRLHSKGHDFQAEDIENDLYTAIDLVADKLDRQVTKFNSKNKEHHSDLKRQDVA